MMLRRAGACVLCIVLVAIVAGCGPRAEGPSGPGPGPAGDREQDGGDDPAGGGGESGGEEGQGSEEITLTGPRVVLGPVVAGCTPRGSEAQAGAVVVIIVVGCDPGNTTTVTVRNDGSEPVAGAALQGTLVFETPPAEPVTASASTSGGECSGPGTSFSCTLNIEPGSSTDVVVTYTRPPETLVARFDLALALAFGT